MKLLVKRNFVGDIGPREIIITFDQYDHDNGSTETANESYELEGEYVTYDQLVTKFGKRFIDDFIQNANDNAR